MIDNQLSPKSFSYIVGTVSVIALVAYWSLNDTHNPAVELLIICLFILLWLYATLRMPRLGQLKNKIELIESIRESLK